MPIKYIYKVKEDQNSFVFCNVKNSYNVLDVWKTTQPEGAKLNTRR